MRDHTVTTALARIVGEQRAPEAAAVALPHPSVRTPHGVLRIAPLLGPAFVACIAYVDPGNCATNFQSGAEHGYLLLSAIVPTAIAQHRFSPDVEAERAAGRQRQQAAHAAEPRPATQLIAAGERA